MSTLLSRPDTANGPTFSLSLSQESTTSGLLEQWLERASFVSDDLEWLLGLPYHRFWSQAVHDRALHIWMADLLQELPRERDLTGQEEDGQPLFSEEASEELRRLTRKLFLVFLRLSTHKESRQNHMSTKHFGEGFPLIRMRQI